MTEAQIVAYNSAAAVAFDDEAAASVQLSALTAKSDLVAAVLYRADGQLFAHYHRDGSRTTALPPPVAGTHIRFTGDSIEVFRDVALRGEHVGTLYLESDMRRWHTRARQYAGFIGAFVLISGGLAFFISSRLQKLVSEPILELERTMRAVSVDKNYAVRAVKASADETGRLIDGFNTMLAEIQHRDRAVQRANGDLKTRTQQLEGEIIHRKSTQDELLKAKHAAEDASRAKSAFLANMSHELRTPLNAIIGYSELLEEEMADSWNEPNLRDLRRIQSAGKHLLALINDVLDLSKIEAGKVALHLETFDVESLVEEMITTLQPAAERNRNRLVLRLAADTGSMHADVTKVRQILFNLLSNACKFTEQGTVTLDVERRRGPEDSARLQGRRHRHRDDPRAAAAAVPVVRAGRCLDVTQVRWHGPGPGDQPALRSSDARRHPRRQHQRPGRGVHAGVAGRRRAGAARPRPWSGPPGPNAWRNGPTRRRSW